MDVFPKFIIETDPELGDCLIISKVTYHNQIVTNEDKVKGGGFFSIDKERNITFNGESHEFGPANLEDIKNCVKNGRVYTNPALVNSITDRHKFFYDSGSEIIPLEIGTHE